MPFTWDDKYIESKANKKTDSLGFKEIGGVGQLVYHLFCYKDYKPEPDKSGQLLAWPVCSPSDPPVINDGNENSGKEILAGLCNLAKRIDSFDEKESYTDLIIEWCRTHCHPYNIDGIYSYMNDPAFNINEDSYWLTKDGVFSIDEFMEELGKLYNSVRFYMALEGVYVAEEDAAYDLYSEGKHFEGLPFFERYKYTVTEPDIDYSSAGGDLLKEMQLDSAYREAHPDEYAPSPEGTFAREPFDDYENLRNTLIETIPDFKMRLKVDPKTNRLTFSADVNSVFEIAWYTLARMMSEDVSPEEKGTEEERPEGVMICCRNCGQFFIRRNNRQEFCDLPECQKARNRINQKRFRDRKKAEKAHKN